MGGHLYFVRHGQTVWNVENKICGAADSNDPGSRSCRWDGSADFDRDAFQLSFDACTS